MPFVSTPHKTYPKRVLNIYCVGVINRLYIHSITAIATTTTKPESIFFLTSLKLIPRNVIFYANSTFFSSVDIVVVAVVVGSFWFCLAEQNKIMYRCQD